MSEFGYVLLGFAGFGLLSSVAGHFLYRAVLLRRIGELEEALDEKEEALEGHRKTIVEHERVAVSAARYVEWIEPWFKRGETWAMTKPLRDLREKVREWRPENEAALQEDRDGVL